MLQNKFQFYREITKLHISFLKRKKKQNLQFQFVGIDDEAQRLHNFLYPNSRLILFFKTSVDSEIDNYRITRASN